MASELDPAGRITVSLAVECGRPMDAPLNVIFVVPYGMETTLRFVRAAAALPQARLALISQQDPSDFPEDLISSLAGFEQLEDALDPEALMGAVRKLGGRMGGRIDRLIGILEQLQEPLAEVREQLGIRGMDVREATNFRDKSVMKDALRAAGLPCAKHALATDAAGALAFARETLPLVAKPPSGAGARDTFRVNALDELQSYLRSAPPSPARPLLLEEFVRGREHSFDSISIGGQHVFHSISRYHPTPLEVMEHPWLQWCVILPREIDGPEFEAIRSAGPRALDVLGMVTGMTHMEWFQREDGSIAISEVAARPPGAQFTSLISFAHDRDFYRDWAEVVVNERFTPPARIWSVGALFLRGQGDGTVSQVRGIEEARAELGPLVAQAKIPRPGQPKAATYEGEGYVILRARDTSEVERGLRRLTELLHVDLE